MTITTLLSYITISIVPLGGVIPGGGLIKCGSYVGEYNQSSKIIYLCEGINITPNMHQFIKYHEVGHYFWFNMMTDSQKNYYTKEYNKAIEIGKHAFHREYSMTNVLEDFADNFALMLQDKKQAYYTNNRIQIIKRIFFITRNKNI